MKNILGIRKRVRLNHGKRAIDVRIIEVLLLCKQAGTQRGDNDASTSMQRHGVASTLMRRCVRFKFPLRNF